MKKAIFLLAILIASLQVLKAQSVIVIQGSGYTKTTTRLDSAVLIAQSGDIIYLPGGVISSYNDIMINKKITLIGAGYNIDSTVSTLPTIFSYGINIEGGGDGTSIVGCKMIGNPININGSVSNISINRCYCTGINIATRKMSTILLSENYIDNLGVGIYNNGIDTFSNIVIKANVINSFSGFFFNNPIQISNNIVLSMTPFGTGGYQNTLFNNNILCVINTTSPITLFNAQNNLVVYSKTTSGTNYYNYALNNVDLLDTSSNLSKVFINYKGYSKNTYNQYIPNLSPLSNFHLVSSCPGKNAGSDGTDVGIYGTANPFKEGGVPFNPHIQSAIITNATDGSGNLKVNIKVAAQKN